MFSYQDIGGKIKGLAKTTFIIEAIGAILSGLAMAIVGIGYIGDYELVTGLLYIVGAAFAAIIGVLVAWISSWLLYGFGEIIDLLFDIEENTSKAVGVQISASEAKEQALNQQAARAALAAEAERKRLDSERRLVEQRLKAEQFELEKANAEKLAAEKAEAEKCALERRQMQEKDEKDRQNAIPVTVNRHSEGICPKCKSVFSALNSMGNGTLSTMRCPKCKRFLKINIEH